MKKFGIEEKKIYTKKSLKKYSYSDYYSLAKMLKTPIYYVIYVNASRSL